MTKQTGKAIEISGYHFSWRWLDLDDTRGSLLLLDGAQGELEDGALSIPEYVVNGGQSWPSDEEVSAAVGCRVRFFDGGDHDEYPEALYDKEEA